MNTIDELELAAADPRRLTPEQHSQLRARLLQRAQEARAQALRDIARGIWKTLRSMAARAWSAWAQRRARRAAMRELYALDDRTLHDIGLGRSEIESVMYDTERLLAREHWAARYQLRTAASKAGKCSPVARPVIARPLSKSAA